MIFTQRTHTCGELRSSHIGQKITLNGWVEGRRNLGGMIFIDLRDRYGKTQIVLEPQYNNEAAEKGKDVRSEYVLSVTGTVRMRPDGMINRSMPTGEIEVIVDEVEILNTSELPPFDIKDEVDAFEDLRLKYRYLDLRRRALQQNLIIRHNMYQVVHRYFDALNFIEVETPVLMKSTPEGARDYLVPSRVHHGKFYALPQSPQQYKQLLMVAGMDRYVQLVKCFRDEDLRADRQPEFTQIDVEMSFVKQENIFEIIEGLIRELFKEITGWEIAVPFMRLDYESAIKKFGSDKPDTRFGMEIVTINESMAQSGFKVFADAVEKGGSVAGINVKQQAGFSRSQLDALTEKAKAFGASGLVWMKAKNGKLESPAAKFLSPENILAIQQEFQSKEGDLILIVADPNAKKAYTALGSLRLDIAKQVNISYSNDHTLLWITDFPLFQWDGEEKRFVAEHHPFTSPHDEDLPYLDSDPAKVRANCYDLVWNGNEVASGSIRIHTSELQAKVFSIMGLSDEEVKEKFGFLLNAFKYGAPPHGGIALGFDRMAAIFVGTPSIRDVIAFPKTNSALSLMDESPSFASQKQLDELHLAIKK